MKGFGDVEHSVEKDLTLRHWECKNMRILRSLFRYRESKTVYKLGCWVLKVLPLPRWVTIKTPYGIVIHPKDFRLFSMVLDLVEPEIQNIFEEWIKEADVFVDVGAAVGWYILKAHKLNAEAIKIAIEPDPVAFNVLKANLAINGIPEYYVKVLDTACSDKEEEIEIRVCVPPSRMRKAFAKPLDTIFKELKVKLSRKSLILIDVEGAGVKVVQGCINVLSMSRPRIIIELHKGEENVEQILKTLGYTVNKPSKHFIVAEAL